MSRTYAHRFDSKGFGSKCQDHSYTKYGYEARFHHHRGVTSVYYNRGKDWWFKPPTWFTTMTVRSTERRQTRDLLRIATRTELDALEDLPFFPHHSLPNADWSWT